MLCEAKHQAAPLEHRGTRFSMHTDPSLQLRMTIPRLRHLANQVLTRTSRST